MTSREFLENGVGDVHVTEIRLLVSHDVVLGTPPRHGGGVFARSIDFLHERPEVFDLSGECVRRNAQREPKLSAASLDDGPVDTWVRVQE